MKKPNPLPIFARISVPQIPLASIGIAYGGTKMTEFYGCYRAQLPFAKVNGGITRFPCRPAPYHAFFIGEDGDTLNVGATRTLIPIWEHFRSTRRIDVITVSDLTDVVRHAMSLEARYDYDRAKPGLQGVTYPILDFLRQEPLLRWIPPSRRTFCSEDVAKRFRKYEYIVTARHYELTDPWDLVMYAMAHAPVFAIHNVWTGPDYAKKYGIEPWDGS